MTKNTPPSQTTEVIDTTDTQSDAPATPLEIISYIGFVLVGVVAMCWLIVLAADAQSGSYQF